MQAETTLRKTPLYEQLADIIEQQIIDDHLPGENLPSEQALCEKYGVSRTVVRESLKLLMARGLINSRTGSGARITRPAAGDVADVMTRIIRMDDMRAEDIYDMRSILEEAAIARAVEHATPGQLEEMQAVLDRLRDDRNLSPMQRRDMDYHFHYLIAQASGNPLLALLVQTAADVFKQVIVSGIFLEGGIDDAVMRHQRIMDALLAQDKKAAVKAMQEHLAQSLRNVQRHQKIESDAKKTRANKKMEEST